MNLKTGEKSAGFTLVELMVVITIIALLASIAVPAFLRGRKRAQASRVINDLRQIESAVDQYALGNNLTAGSAVTTAAWSGYLKRGTVLYSTGLDVLGNSYGDQTVDIAPKVPAATLERLIRRRRDGILLALRSLLGMAALRQRVIDRAFQHQTAQPILRLGPEHRDDEEIRLRRKT